ncbi:hypothetical protein F2Q69_00025281 [Brassica cretica]|uniref:Uncharacterized protein n=1 Tax=Brassica cretica TaxID=69181 RepID=A0A8S9QK40_BRACR|nr:hypothetical protein F2Q69_00025281 [Brassica cretica]
MDARFLFNVAMRSGGSGELLESDGHHTEAAATWGRLVIRRGGGVQIGAFEGELRRLVLAFHSSSDVDGFLKEE